MSISELDGVVGASLHIRAGRTRSGARITVAVFRHLIAQVARREGWLGGRIAPCKVWNGKSHRAKNIAALGRTEIVMSGIHKYRFERVDDILRSQLRRIAS